MKKFSLLFVLTFVAVLFVSSCADMNVPTPKNIIQNPVGNNAAKVGMSKTEIKSIYKDPDFVSTVISDNWAGPREEWFYKAEVGIIPVVNSEYLSEDMYMYFDDDRLTNISNRPLGKAIEENIK